jgi:hypothetical protein
MLCKNENFQTCKTLLDILHLSAMVSTMRHSFLIYKKLHRYLYCDTITKYRVGSWQFHTDRKKMTQCMT